MKQFGEGEMRFEKTDLASRVDIWVFYEHLLSPQKSREYIERLAVEDVEAFDLGLNEIFRFVNEEYSQSSSAMRL